MARSGAERQAAYRARRRAKGLPLHPERERRAGRPWCFIDTEGGTDTEGVWGDRGRQYTFLICAASDDGFENYLYTGKPLATAEMLQFISRLPKKYKFGGYFFGYDRDQILRTAPEHDLRTLYGTAKENGEPIVFGRFVVEAFASRLTVIAPPDIT